MTGYPPGVLKRWTAIGYTAALATSPAWVTACNAPQAADAQEASVLFSLTSDSMRFEDPSGMDVTLVMEGVDPHTVWFTDRPERKSGAITTSQLAAEWADGETFDEIPPNAALVLHEPVAVDDVVTETLVAEILDASYDETAGTFTADIRVLLDEEASELEGQMGHHGANHGRAWPTQAGAVSLFIDSVNLDAVTVSDSPSPTAATTASPAATTASPAATTASPAAAAPTQSASAAPAGAAPTTTSASPSTAATTAFPSPSVPTTKSPVPTQQKVTPKIKLCSSPSTCQNTTTNYTVNSTIYFQISIDSNVTMQSVVSYQPDGWRNL